MDVKQLKLQNGFTLIELVVVIIILAILATMVLIRAPSKQVNVNGQAEQLASDIRYTQTLSMTQGQRYCIVFSASSYQIINSATATAVILTTGSTITLNSGISYVPGTGMLVFDGQGTPYTSAATTCNTTNANAATAMTSTLSISFSSGTNTNTVSISPETGRVIVQ